MGAAAAGVCAVVWLGDPTTPGGFLPTCPTKMLLGIDCPGCGTLRMIYSLLHGDITAALRFNAVALAALALLTVAFGVWTFSRVTGRPMASWQHHRWAAPLALVVVIVWFVLRILPFEPFTALRV